MTTGIGVESEIGRLRRVFVHAPGREVEFMTPKQASELLYNDILYYSHLREGHTELSGVLGLVAEVLEVEDVLISVLDNPAARSELLHELTVAQGCPELVNGLMQIPSSELGRLLICGVPIQKTTLERFLANRSFSLVPLPNMYFMRDTSIVVGQRVISSRMASLVRQPEAVIMRTLYKYNPSLQGAGLLFDGSQYAGDPEITLEGGDVLVVSRDLLLIGASERTTTRAIDRLAESWVDARRRDQLFEPFDIIAVVLPHERSTIHLDMIFTFVDREQAIVYEPYVMGREACRAVRVTVSSDGKRRFREHPNLLLALRDLGLNISPILCGGSEPLHQDREQWTSGANMFCFAPGKAISYGMHEQTVRACEQAGFRTVAAEEVMANPTILDGDSRLIVTVDGTELARGGGGPRCMTCPVLRDPL